VGEPASGGALPEGVRAELVELIAGELRAMWDEAVAAGAPASRLARSVGERIRLITRSATARGGGVKSRRPGPDLVDPGVPAGATVRKYLVMASEGGGSTTVGPPIKRFVGRERELTRLLKMLEAARARWPHVVLLEGDAGVGKSRLVQQYCAAAGNDTRVLVGASVPLSSGRPTDSGYPYAPLIDALRRFVREHGDEAASLAGPAWSELQGLVKDFTDVETPDGTAVRAAVGSGSQLQVFGAVMRLLDHLGAEGPVLVVFEDIHWADPSTLDLVSYLSRVKTNERMVLLCSFRGRPAAGHPLHRLLAEQGFIHRTEHIRLEPFTERELRLLLGDGKPVDRDLVHRNFTLSGGNAFFAEELHDTLSRSGDEHPQLPESLQTLMVSRIEVIDDRAQRVLSVAATAGRRVSEQLLAAVSRLDDDTLADALRRCLDQDLLVADRNDDSYHFRHALLGEAVYDRLAGFERRKLHVAMAQAITGNPALSLDESLAAVELAHHWYAAGRKPEALAAAVAAGAANARIRAFREAEMQYKRALRLWNAVPDAVGLVGMRRDEILAVLADAARWAGHVDQAVEHTLLAIGEIDQATDPHRAAELYERLGSYQWEAGASAQSTRAYEEALRLLINRPADALKVRVQAVLAITQVRAGRLREGLEQAQAAARQAENIGARAEVGRALSTVGVARTLLGQAQDGIAVLRHALRIAQETGNLEDLLRTHANLEVVLEHSGALTEAVDAALDGIEDARRYGLTDTRHGGILANNASVALFQLGRWDEAVELLDEALLIGPAVSESRYMRLTRAEIEVARGHFAEADSLLGQLRQQADTDPRFLETLFACEANLALGRGDLEAARKAADNGIIAVKGSENELATLRTYTIALRVTADARPSAHDRREVDRRADKLIRQVNLVPRGPGNEVAVLRQQCAAEADRARGRDDASGWAAVAAGWETIQRPYATAYARWREAVAAQSAGDQQTAVRASRQARETAERLRAVPLLDELESLRAAIGGECSPAAELTARESQIVRLLATGATYRKIGHDLSIAESTVSVHASKAKKKLNLRTRDDVIAWVHQNPATNS
jgi:DNA-binding CsgD family transcriptional regulator/tetratricopeptide (TPR) repeat protein